MSSDFKRSEIKFKLIIRTKDRMSREENLKAISTSRSNTTCDDRLASPQFCPSSSTTFMEYLKICNQIIKVKSF